jgi:hypothetical protein
MHKQTIKLLIIISGLKVLDLKKFLKYGVKLSIKPTLINLIFKER